VSLSLAVEPYQVTALAVFQQVIPHELVRLFQGPQQAVHPGSNGGSASSASSAGDQSNDPPGPGPSLRPEKSLGVFPRGGDTLAMEVEGCVGLAVGPIGHGGNL
jgi:hypothetical protein